MAFTSRLRSSGSGVGFGVRMPEFKRRSYYLVCKGPCASDLTSLCLGFFHLSNGLIILPISYDCLKTKCGRHSGQAWPRRSTQYSPAGFSISVHPQEGAWIRALSNVKILCSEIFEIAITKFDARFSFLLLQT